MRGKTTFFCYLVCLLCITSTNLFAQVTTNGGSGLATTYPTLASAITALNGATINSPVVITLTGNETAPAGGYSITASGTSTNTITIQGSSSTITAFAGQTSGNLTDAIFKLIGADWITIKDFTMQENSANTTTTAASNNMTEWGVALLYASTTNGAQNNTIHNNVITLNRSYQNTFGIYANATHSATAPTTSATATTGNNSGLRITSNSISNINFGIIVIGPTAAADHNDGIIIGGNASNANTITNYGTTSTFSSYANVSGTVNGVLVRNSKNFTISHNTITSSNGGTTSGTLRGIFIPSFTNAPTGTITNVINNNTISVTTGVAAGTLQGIVVETTTGNLTTTLNIDNNNFTNCGYNIANPTGAFTAISDAMANLTTTISNNTFTNLSISSTGAVIFISHGFSIPSTGILTISGNSIVTAFTRTAAGAITLTTSNSTSGTGSINNYTNNNFSNIIVPDNASSTITGFNNTDGGTGSTKTITGNTFSNWHGGTSGTTGTTGTINVMNFSYWNGTSTLSNNNISNITGRGSITGVTMGATSSVATLITVAENNINNLNSIGTGGNVTGITCSNTSTAINIRNNSINNLTSTGASSIIAGIIISGATNTSLFSNVIHSLTGSGTTSPVVNGISVSAGTTVNVFKNKIYGLSQSGAISTTTGAVNGMLFSGGTTVNAYNNLIGNLTAPAASLTDAIRAISVTSTTASSTLRVYYNTIYLNASSTGTNFGTTGVFHTASSTASTATLDLRNNIIINLSTPVGTGVTAVLRRSAAATYGNWATTSNRNLLFAGTPGTTRVILADGATNYQNFGTASTAGTYRNTVGTRDENSIPGEAFDYASVGTSGSFFESLTGSNARFLLVPNGTVTRVEGAGSPIGSPSITDDFEGTPRNNTTPDIGADEFDGTAPSVCSGTPASANVQATSSTVCSGKSTTLSLSTLYSDLGIEFKWQSATTSGGPYTDLGTNATLNTANLTTSTYFRCIITCSGTGDSHTTDEILINVNSLPTVTLTPSNATYCTPGGTAVALAASGANTYSWSPSTGLSATTGATVNATPSSTQNYTVTGTDGNGCTNTATANVTVSGAIVISSTVASPTAVCVGGSTQLSVNAIATANSASTLIFSSSTGQSLETIISPTVVTTVSSGSADDGFITVTPASFNFNYLGSSVSTFNVGTNGYVLMGTTTPSTSIPSNLTTHSGFNIVYGFGRDGNLNVANGGNLTHGAAAGGKYVFQLTNYSGGSSGGESSTVRATIQFVFWGSTSASPGRIDVIYETNTGTPATAGVIGIRDAAGNYINAAAAGSTSLTSTASAWPASGTMYSFRNPSASSFSWTPQALINDPTINNPTASNITENTTFNVTASANGCSASGSVTVSVISNAIITTHPTATVTRCAGQPTTLTVAAEGPGLTYQWRKDGVDIDIVANASAATATLNLGNIAAGAAGSYDVVVTASCGAPVISNASVIIVNTLPTVTVTPSSATYCTPSGAAVALASSGANTYSWSPSTGLSATTGATVNATPSSTQTYTVTGTDGNGCTNTATAVITTSSSLSVTVATATPSSVCLGGNTQLSATATVAGSSYTFASIVSPVLEVPGDATITTLSGATSFPVNTSGTLGDDSYSNAINLPFSFSFFGSPVSQLWASSNGYITFSNPSTGITSSQQRTTQTLPNSTVPNNLISLFWHDMDIRTQGTVTHYVIGTSPNRKFVIQFNGVATYVSTPPSANLHTGQIVLNESNGSIQLYVSSSPSATKTLGLENANGTVGLAPTGRNNVSWTVTSLEGWNFTPPTITYAWTPSTLLNDAAIINPSASNITQATTFTVTASSNGCSASRDVTVSITSPVSTAPASGTYVYGAVNNTGYATAANWYLYNGTNYEIASSAPTATSNVIIPATGTCVLANPVLSTATTVNNLEIQTGATLGLSGQTLTINGTVTGSGTLTGSSGSNVEIGGTGALGTLNFTQTTDGTTNTLQSLTLNRSGGSATIGNKLVITNVLTATAGTLNTGGFLHLRSTASGTARVAPVGGDISGNVTVERFIPATAGRAWRLLAAPLSATGAPTIKDAWQEGVNNTTTTFASNQNPNPGYGTHITLSGGSANGFDESNGSASIKYFNGTTLPSPANTNTTKVTDNGGAYFVFIRGNRGLDVTNLSSVGSTTLRMRGALNIGNVTTGIAGTGTLNFSLIPNPYASAVDFEKIRSGNGSSINSFYIYDANIKNYRLIDRTNVDEYNSTPFIDDQGTLGTATNENAARFIQSGQAFWVPGQQQLNFTENMKTDGVPVINAFKTNGTEQQMIVNLKVNNNGTFALIDGIRVRYNTGFSKQVLPTEDYAKFAGFNENMAVLREAQSLTIERRPFITDNDTIFLRLWNTGTKAYQFELQPINIDPTLSAFIEDAYLNTSMPIDITAPSTVLFNVDLSIPASAAQNRFRIVFKTGSTLPITKLLINATQKDNRVQVDYTALGESGMEGYEVERSINGIEFTKMAVQKALGNNNGTMKYGWIDENPVNGDNFYRIKAIDKSGKIQFSNIAKVKMNSGKQEIFVYPNPVKGEIITLHMNKAKAGTYTVRMFNTIGQEMYNGQVQYDGGSATRTLHIPALSIKGTYSIQISNGETTINQTIISQ